jgi:hypothetical protein
MNDPNTSLIRAIALLGGVVIASIVALVIWGPADGGLVTATVTAIGALAALLVSSLLTLRASSEARAEARVAASTAAAAADTAAVAATAATASRAVSDKNAATLAHVSRQVTNNTVTTEATHSAVNSRMDQLILTVQQLAEAQQRLSNAQSLAQGIVVGREQAAQEGVPIEVVERVVDEQVKPIVQTEVQRVVEEHKEEGH